MNAVGWWLSLTEDDAFDGDGDAWYGSAMKHV